jgi:putative ABC transport system substrate-binding protein
VVDEPRSETAAGISTRQQPGDLPIEATTVPALGINLKTARALGIEVAAQLLARAHEVFE